MPDWKGFFQALVESIPLFKAIIELRVKKMELKEDLIEERVDKKRVGTVKRKFRRILNLEKYVRRKGYDWKDFSEKSNIEVPDKLQETVNQVVTEEQSVQLRKKNKVKGERRRKKD